MNEVSAYRIRQTKPSMTSFAAGDGVHVGSIAAMSSDGEVGVA